MKLSTILHYTPLVILLLAFLGLSFGCATMFEDDDEELSFDSRPILLGVQLNTHRNGTQLMVEKMFGSAIYSVPWSPNGGMVPQAEVGLSGCGFRVNQIELEPDSSNMTDYGYGYHWYKSGTGAEFEYAGPIVLKIGVPSVDERHAYGYPPIYQEVYLNEGEIIPPVVEGALQFGDTLRFQFHWPEEILSAKNVYALETGIQAICSYSRNGMFPGTVYFRDTLNVLESFPGEVKTVLKEQEIPPEYYGVPNKVTIVFSMLTALWEEERDLVPEKKARIIVGERRSFSYRYNFEYPVTGL